MASITVDIEARVKGYQEAIEKMRAEFAKLDPGSQMGKSISRALTQAESQVKNLSKNMFPKASSDNQIDAIVDKVNRAGESIMHVSQLMQQVGASDLNLGALGADIENFRSQIAALQADLETKLSQGLLNAVSNSNELKSVFQDILGIDLSKAKGTELFDQLAKGALHAAQEVEKAEKAVNQAQANLNKNVQAREAIDKSPFGSIAGTQQLQNQVSGFQKEYEAAFSELKTRLQEGLSKTLQGDTSLQKKLLDDFFQGLNPSNIRDRINTLVSELKESGAVSGQTGLREIYNQIFGIDEKGSTWRNVANLVDFDKVSTIKEQFRNLVQQFTSELTRPEAMRLTELINSDNIEEAANKTVQDIDKAFNKIQTQYQKRMQEMPHLEEVLAQAHINLQNAQATQSNITGANTDLQAKYEQLLTQYQQQQDQITKLKQQLDALTQQKAQQISTTGAGAGQLAANQIFPTEEANKYKTAVEQVRSAEQMVGKIQGVVQRWFSVYAAVRMVGKAIRSVISTIQELDKTITEIAIVTNMTQDQLWGQMGTYIQTAKDYATSISGVYKVSQLYYQQGLQQADVMALTEQTLKMARVSGLEYATATDYMTNAIRSFKMEMTEASTVVDVYSAIAASSATSVTELASAMSKTASSAQAVGSSFENTTAMMAVMIEATRESAENIGSAMKSIISRYGEMTSDPSKTMDSEGQEMSLNRVDKALQTVGISIHDAAGQFRDFDEVIMELAEKWNTIDKNTQRYIATIMAGNRQQSRFLALVSSYDRLKDLSEKAANSEDASQLQFLKTLDSIDAKTQQLQTSLQSLYTEGGIEKLYKRFLDFSKAIVDTLKIISKSPLGTTGVILKIGTTFMTVANMVGVAFGLMKQKISAQIAALSAKETANAQAQSNNRVQQEQTEAEQIIAIKERVNARIAALDAERTGQAQAQSNARINQAEMASSTQNNGGKFHLSRGVSKKAVMGGLALSAAGTIVTGYSATMERGAAKGWLGTAGSTLSGAGMGATMGGGYGAIIGAIIGVIIGVIENWGNFFISEADKLEMAQTKAKEAQNKYLEKRNDTTNLNQSIQEIKELEKHRYDSIEAEEAYYEATNKLGELYPTLVDSMDEYGNVTIDLAAAEEELANSREEAIKTAKEAASANHAAAVQAVKTQKQERKDTAAKTYSLGFVEAAGRNTVYGKLIDLFIKQNPQSELSKVAKWDSHNAGSYNDTIWLPQADQILSSDDAARGVLLHTNELGNPFLSNKLSQQEFANKYKGKAFDFISEEERILWGLTYGDVAESWGDLRSGLQKENHEKKNKNFQRLVEQVQKFKLNEGVMLNEEQLKWLDELSWNELLAEDKYSTYDRQLYAYLLSISGRETLANAKDTRLNNKITSTDRSGLAGIIGSLMIGTEDTSFYNEMTGARNFLVEAAMQEFKRNEQNEDYDTFIGKGKEGPSHAEEYAVEVATEMDSIWSSLTAYQKNRVNEIIKNAGKYSSDQLENELISGGFTNEIVGFITASLQNGVYTLDKLITKMNDRSGTNENIIQALTKAYGAGENLATKFGSSELERLADLQDEIDSYVANNAISSTQAGNFIESYANILKNIDDVYQNNPAMRELAQEKLFNQTDWSINGIFELYDSLEQMGVSPLVLNAVKGLKDYVPVNLASELNTFQNTLVTNFTNFEKSLSSATKGFSLKEATEWAAKTGKRLSDFDKRDGKYYFKDLNDLYAEYSENDNEYLTAIQEQIDNFNQNAGPLIGKKQITKRFNTKNANFEDWKTIILKWAGLQPDASTTELYNSVYNDDLDYVHDQVAWTRMLKSFGNQWEKELVQIEEDSIELDKIISPTSNFEEVKQGLSDVQLEGFDTDTLVNYAQLYLNDTSKAANTTFTTWLKTYLQDLYDETDKELKAASKNALARAQIQTGDIRGFVNTALEKVSLLTEDEIDQIYAFGGPDAEKLIAAEETSRREDLIDRISRGDTSDLSPELQEYAKLIYDTFHSVQTSVVNSLFTAVRGGQQNIFVNSANKGILKQFVDAGYFTADKSDWTDDGKELKENAELKANIEEFEKTDETNWNNFVRGLENATNEEKLKFMSDYYAIKYPDLSSSIDKDTLSISEFQNIITGLEGQDEALKWDEKLNEYGLQLNLFTGQLERVDETLITKLEDRLKTVDKDSELYKKYQAQLDSAKRTQTYKSATKMRSALSNVLKNYKEFDEQTYEALQESLSSDDFDIIQKYITDHRDGTFSLQGDLNQLLNIDGITESTKNVLRELIAGIADDYLAAISTATDYVAKGTTKQADMQKFVEEYNRVLPGNNKQVKDLFEWNDILESFTLKPEYLQGYIEAQKIELGKQGFDPDTIEQFITSQINQLQAAVDFSSFFQADNRTENGKAYKTIRKNMETTLRSKLSPEKLSENYEEYLEEALLPEDEQYWYNEVGGMGDFRTGSAEYRDLANKTAEEARKHNKQLIADAKQKAQEESKALQEQLDLDMTALLAGGSDAIAIMRKYAAENNQELTSEQIEQAYRLYINDLQSLGELLPNLQIGSIVDENTVSRLKQLGITDFTADENGVIIAVGDMVAAYQAIYDAMKEAAGHTTSDINKAYAQLRTAQEQGDIDAVAAMGDAMGMTYETLGDILAKQGLDLEKWLRDNSNLYQSIGAGKIRLTDFTSFAAQMGWEPGSEEYTSAFKAYNDSLIEMNSQTKKSIEDEIKGLQNVKGGDQLNLTELYTELQKQIKYQVEYGYKEGKLQSWYGNNIIKSPVAELQEALGGNASLINGILTLNKNANLIGVAQALTAAAEKAGIELSAEIQDMIQNIIKSYAEAITNGIKGTLDNAGREDLINKAASLGITNLQFTQTTEGFKLAQSSAIQLYGTIRQIDAMQGKLVFDELNQSLQESNEHYKGITDIMNRISWLSAQIKSTDGTVSNARKQQYAEELALAEQILAVRSTTEDSSFNFMSNKIPDGQNNPINYYNNWAKAIKTLNDAVENQGSYNKRDSQGNILQENIKSGFVDYQDWYNIVTEMNNLAKLSGPIRFAGQTLYGDLKSAADLIQAGAESLVVTDTGEVKVALQGMALDFEDGASTFSGGVDAGIREVAKGQVEMLDGMIQLLETIVAMQDLGEIAGDNGTIEIKDIMPTIEWDEDGNAIEKSIPSDFDQKYKDWRQALIDKITEKNKDGTKNSKYNKELAKAMGNIEIDGESLETIINYDTATLAGKGKQFNEAYATFLNAMMQAAQSGDYNLDNIASSVQEIFAASGLSGFTIKLGDQVYELSYGVMVKKNKDNKYETSKGTVYNDVESAAQAEILEQDRNIKDININENKQVTGTITIGTTKFTVSVDDKGKKIYTDENGTSYPSEYAATQAAFEAETPKEERSFESYKDWSVKTLGKLVVGEVKITNADDFTARTTEQVTQLATALAGQDNQAIINAAKQLGISVELTGGILTEEQKANIAQLAGITRETQVVNVVTGNTDDAVKKLNDIKEKITEIDALAPSIDVTVNDSTKSGVDSVLAELNRIPNRKNVLVQAKGNIGMATGNAQAKGTLMGELGPELVVQNGRYFVAGQNGAEFVDLQSDAIVFNHLQTQQLLKNGMSSSRGRAVTNERVATAYAQGNVNGGPAMASASAALAALKQLRAEWQALAGLSVSDLAGKGGGGGGGGGDKELPGFIRDVERWYNWLQKIADLEKQINYEEQLRSKIQSDAASNGRAYYDSQIRQLNQLNDSIATSSSLYLSQKEYFEQRRNQLNNNSPLSELYTFDESGQLHYQEGSYQWLASLFKTNDYGALELTPQQQYEMILKRNPEFAQYMKYNSEGKEIKEKDYKDNKDQYYLDMVKAFSDRMDSEKDEMQNLFDSINEQGNAVNEKLEQQNELIQAMKDNQKEVEEAVLKAIEESRQRQIDEAQKDRDAYSESTDRYIEGLNKALADEQKMYQNQESKDEVDKLRRQLAILQRSGGSASQIANLQKEIQEKDRDLYFDQYQQQIDAVKEASDLQLERLDHQIELMEETLAYEKEHGLLWEQVYEVMAKTPEEISSFIQENTAEEWAKSPLSSTEAANDWIFKTEQWTSFRDDIHGIYDSLNAAWNIFGESMSEMFGSDWENLDKETKSALQSQFTKIYQETGDYNKAAEAIEKSDTYQTLKKKKDEEAAKARLEAEKQSLQQEGSSSNASTAQLGRYEIVDNKKNFLGWMTLRAGQKAPGAPAKAGYIASVTYNSVPASGAIAGQTYKIEYTYTKSINIQKRNAHNDAILNKNNNNDLAIGLRGYDSGGLIDYTGPAMVHGTPQKPEGMLNAEQLDILRNNILSKKNPLISAIADFQTLLDNTASATINNNSSPVVIENATVAMNVQQLANDYDARRAGESALEEIMKIARKTGAQGVARR